MSALGLRHPVDSPVHRTPPGVKVGLLAALGVGVAWIDRPWQVAATLAVLTGVLALARVPAPVAWRQVRPVLPLLALVVVAQALLADVATGVAVAGVVLVLVVAAAVVTLTTSVTELTDVLVTCCRPLRVGGVDAERVGLAVALGIRSVAVVAGLAAQVRDAQRARGLVGSPRAYAVPLVVRSLRHADRLAEALAARGLDD